MFNVLTTAMTVIPPEELQYERWQGNTINSIGLDVASYAEAVMIKGSIQHHVSEKMYQAYGLSLNKHYALVDVPAELYGSQENLTPDRLTFHNNTWIVLKNNNWYIYNGWVKLIVVAEKDYTDGEE
jgi:hypothetical protein